MKKLHFSIIIAAPKETVWRTMLDDVTYRQWTVPFHSDTYYEGDWSEGSRMLFLCMEHDTGKASGMVSRIAKNKPYEYVSIEHLGFLRDGVEDTTSADAMKWKGVFENYTFKDQGGATEVLIDIDVAEEYVEMFEKMWPEALQALKKLSETTAV